MTLLSQAAPALAHDYWLEFAPLLQFTATETGAWLVRAVHMHRCTACKDAEWESFWTGYTFALR